jgi:hypothetical protein
MNGVKKTREDKTNEMNVNAHQPNIFLVFAAF